ncbi:translesion DNA synthesis-associated protein ImuA [Janthinobacterium sp. 17J80-10]|uniref:translesion DNA synthesis-associated protein ImuA n=1 Tax=Janthinobacterium sp. 17J80-10 TaxID=2497863 RepID=UPI00100575EF|nr:translesion DNA synthesis-associated protein ImuA [Janthinobacterium sp. 17J80-10]QAU34482.1 translesion DNA synthesis-associated protein ImuA [Janthinobacterium sp. 17J80-10]
MSLCAAGPAAQDFISAASLSHAVWRATQMATHRADAVASGHAALDPELPDGGWPKSALIELLPQQCGIGEMRLLRPALASIAQSRRIALVQPPHAPQIAAWAGWGLPAERLLWVKADRSADALWSVEQILRNGSCGALVFWQTHIRPEALRRLHLAAQAGDAVFWLLRPLAGAQDASPAPLRLALRPARAGIDIHIIKRRGPVREDSLFIPLALPAATIPFNPSSVRSSHHAPVDRHAPAAIASRNPASALV